MPEVSKSNFNFFQCQQFGLMIPLVPLLVPTAMSTHPYPNCLVDKVKIQGQTIFKQSKAGDILQTRSGGITNFVTVTLRFDIAYRLRMKSVKSQSHSVLEIFGNQRFLLFP